MYQSTISGDKLLQIKDMKLALINGITLLDFIFIRLMSTSDRTKHERLL